MSEFNLTEEKKRIIDHTVKLEGGYVNDPNDSGGETMYGITLAVARKYGYKESMKNLPLNIANSIYETQYWDRLLLDEIFNENSRNFCEKLFDISVNAGVSRAGKFLQKTINLLNYYNIAVDGVIGNNTISSLKSLNENNHDGFWNILYKCVNCLQGEHYINLCEKREKDESFIFGWFSNRIGLSKIKDCVDFAKDVENSKLSIYLKKIHPSLLTMVENINKTIPNFKKVPSKMEGRVMLMRVLNSFNNKGGLYEDIADIKNDDLFIKSFDGYIAKRKDTKNIVKALNCLHGIYILSNYYSDKKSKYDFIDKHIF